METQHTAFDEKQMRAFLEDYDFETAFDYLYGTTDADGELIIRHLHSLAEGETGLLVYSFITTLLNVQETSFMHRAAAVVLFEALGSTKGAHRAAAMHISQAIALNPADWYSKSFALALYKEGLIDEEEAAAYAKTVLRHDPNHKVAKELREKASA